MEATTTLADALLDDLDDLTDSDQEEEEGEQQEGGDKDDDDNKVAIKTEDMSDVDAAPSASLPSSSGAAGTTKKKKKSFLDNPSLQDHLKTIRSHPYYGGGGGASIKIKDNDSTDQKPSAVPSSSASASKSQKEREEDDHQLVVTTNKHLANLSEELGKAHGELASAYSPKFPELEELVPNYIQYKNTVRLIGNEMDLTKVDTKLQEILTSNQIITISVAGSTTSGRLLTESELERVDEACTYMEQLLEVQSEMIRFVENSMESLCPSICALIGPSVAARLLGLAGGLAELTKIPSCNLQVMGQVKQNSSSRAGLSTSSTKVHAGILMETELVSQVPKHLQKKALKTIAAKLALTARYDFINVDTGRKRSASTGLKFRQELHEKFEKWLEPDKAQVLKALPKPDLTVKKRRGGKRMRRWKERFEETALMKQANTRAFSSQQGEYGDDAMGITMGLLDTADSGGNIRKQSGGEKRKMRQANTKASRKRAQIIAQKNERHQQAVKDGLASSVVFNQSSSMELANPDANKDRVREANRKWFNENAGFQSALPPKK